MADNAFFDVLIDQIIRDVRREFESVSAEVPGDHRSDTTGARMPGRAGNPDDLVSRLLDFRLRQNVDPQGNGETPTKRVRARMGVEADAVSDRLLKIGSILGGMQSAMQAAFATNGAQAVAPNLPNAEAEVAFALLAKNGAKFLTTDFAGPYIYPQAMRRERRRLLLNLHPDRHPEAQRKQAHERFLVVADAFTSLSENAMWTSDELAA